MKIAYATQYDPEDIKQWSGTVKHISKSIQSADFEVEAIGSLSENLSLFYKLKQIFYKKILKKSYLRNREMLILSGYASQIYKRLENAHFDVVFSPESLAISYLECKLPIVFWTDATFAGMVDFYPKFFNLDQQSLANGHKVDKLALDRSRLAIYSSDWAAKTAIDFYQADPAKVKVVPFGANIQCDRTLEDIKTIIQTKSKNCCKLLFLGVDWRRKGGDLALKVANSLHAEGLPIELYIVGCQPPASLPLPSYVKTLGFISKSNSEGIERINQLFIESHFLILPSLADCTPVVFSEASSFGLPCIATNVGGIPTIIREGYNGKTFPLDASVQDYCRYIEHLFSNYSDYENLCLSAFNEYQTRLNWDVAGQAVRGLLAEL